MPDAYLVEAVRTPVGRRGGGLATVHPVDLAARVLQALVERSGLDPGAVDDVVMGCLDQIGPQAADIARTAWLAAGLPHHVPGVTVDRQCGSSQQAVHFAAQAVMSGTADLVVAAGVQSMSLVPMQSSYELTGSTLGPFNGSEAWAKHFGDQEVTQFRGAELMVSKFGIESSAMDELAVESHQRALRAIEEGRFEREIVPYGEVSADEGPRRDTSVEAVARLKPLRDGGVVNAAHASQIADGAAALLVASASAIERYGLRPRARIVHLGVIADDPIVMLSAPIPATRRALERTGLSMDDIDLFEVNEAFAPVVLAWAKELGADLDKVNVNGGGIALGHPLGATGARLMTTLLHELERQDARFGLQTLCELGGQANVTIIERV